MPEEITITHAPRIEALHRNKPSFWLSGGFWFAQSVLLTFIYGVERHAPEACLKDVSLAIVIAAGALIGGGKLHDVVRTKALGILGKDG